MTNVIGIVEVSSGDPTSNEPNVVGSLAARRFGGNSLLEWIVRRVSESLLLDQVAVVADRQQGHLVRRLAPAGVTVYVGDEPDALGRFAGALRVLEATQVIRIPLSCPFIDPELIDRLVGTAGGNPSWDYIGYFSLDGRPAVLSKVGLFAEWCRAEAVLAADAAAELSADRADATRYLYSHPERFQLRYIPMPTRLDRLNLRLRVDLAEDWELAHLIFEALGPEGLDWYAIASLLDQQPAVRAGSRVSRGD